MILIVYNDLIHFVLVENVKKKIRFQSGFFILSFSLKKKSFI